MEPADAMYLLVFGLAVLLVLGVRPLARRWRIDPRWTWSIRAIGIAIAVATVLRAWA